MVSEPSPRSAEPPAI
ncbi:hypothetical protein A2U01_0100014, partial [Trifolium medium]|nr:hypothetical protein [Trifolium medium]